MQVTNTARGWIKEMRRSKSTYQLQPFASQQSVIAGVVLTQRKSERQVLAPLTHEHVVRPAG